MVRILRRIATYSSCFDGRGSENIVSRHGPELDPPTVPLSK
jgi:hypothetical protein